MEKKTIGQRLGWKEESKAGKIIFLTALIIYTAVMLYLFLMQCYEVPEFESDMPAYVDKVAGIQGDYEFPYPLFFVTAQIFAVIMGAPAAVAFVTALFNAFAVCVVKYYFNREVRSFTGYDALQGKRKIAIDIAVTVSVFVLFLISNLYSPKNTAFFGFDYAYRCMGIYTPNPFWNATYMATRPFAIICFFEAVAVLRNYRSEFSWKGCMPFAISLLLTTLTKPSYTLVIVPLLGIILLVQLIGSKGKCFTNAFKLCVTLIPTGLALLYQYSGLFTGVNSKGEDTGIGFEFAAVWSNFSKSIPLSIVMGMALTLGVAVLNYRELQKNSIYQFAWANYLVGAVTFLCLYEKGFRMMHANFSWGYMHGMFCVFMITLILVIKNTVQWWKTWKMLFVLAEWGVLSIHLICGVNFLMYALQGNALGGF